MVFIINHITKIHEKFGNIDEKIIKLYLDKPEISDKIEIKKNISCEELGNQHFIEDFCH